MLSLVKWNITCSYVFFIGYKSFLYLPWAMQTSVLWTNQLTSSHVHLVCTSFSALTVWTSVVKASKRLIISLTPEMNSYSEIVAHVEFCSCCDPCVNVKGAAVCMCPSQRDMIPQCTRSAYTQLIVHAQLWCQSLCGKPWCMERGACWAVWVCCCHDNHPLDKCAAQKGDWAYVRVSFCCSAESRLSLCMAGQLLQ